MKNDNKKIKKEDKKAKGDSQNNLDEELFSHIQPAGGITFKDPSYITTGDGYVRCLHIYKLPKILDDFWLDHIFNIKNAIVTMDISTKDSAEVKKNINKSLKEEFARSRTAKDFMEAYDAEMRKEELQSLYDELSSMGEVMKVVDLRIFVKGRNLVELDEECEAIIKQLESNSFMTATLLNEGKREWQSMFESATTSHSKPFSMNGFPLLTDQIAFGNPYCYSELLDETGDLIGFTPVDGAVLFDEFTKTESRKHYNSLVVGDMGSGKSTYLKKRFKANAAKGNYLRTFDVTGEFKKLTKEFGGKIIKCNGTDGMLNPLEILKGGDDDYTSYSKHIAKVSTFYRCLTDKTDDETFINLENYLREFYEKFELVPQEGRSITGRPAKTYPIFSDFEAFLKEKIDELRDVPSNSEADKAIIRHKAVILTSLLDITTKIISSNGHMFNGHTSVDNIVDEKIVTFDISDIKDAGAAFTAQMFNMVSLCWDNAVNNGAIMKELYDSKTIEGKDATCFLVLIDESHRWVNTSMPQILTLLIQYLREARKYFAGITFASQSIRDYMPEGENGPYVDLLRTLFELTQYKLMFRQDSSTMPLLNKVFDNALSFSQLEQIPYLNTGDTILAISGDRSIKFKVYLDKEYEEELFSGGR